VAPELEVAPGPEVAGVVEEEEEEVVDLEEVVMKGIRPHPLR